MEALSPGCHTAKLGLPLAAGAQKGESRSGPGGLESEESGVLVKVFNLW